VRRMAYVAAAEDRMRQAPDRDRPAARGELLEKAHGYLYFGAGGTSVRARFARTVWMSRDDVPEQDVVLEVEIAERPVNDRRRRLGGARSGKLALGRERDAAHARTPVAGGLPHEEERRRRLPLEIGRQPPSAPVRLGVLVEGGADPSPRELLDEARGTQEASLPRR
jgi:hypothetical protein